MARIFLISVILFCCITYAVTQEKPIDYINSNLSEIYSGGIERLYERIYNNGPAEGYLTVAKSFYDSGFIHEAADAIKCGFESVDKMRERADENSLKLESELKILDVAVQLRNGSK